jgi:hypothetical protein
MAVGAALAFWFWHFVMGDEQAATAGQVMTFIWLGAFFFKRWLDRKEGAKDNG